jgi:hypothetical protein
VSNYGFIEDPVRMIRAARFAARLGWQMEEKTKARYETGKAEGYISAMSAWQRGYESEEIVHEEDPLRVMRGLEHEGWMKVLAPAWTSAKANVAELEKLRDAQMQLSMRGINADAAAAQFPLLTAKMNSKDVSVLKRSFPRHGFVTKIEALEAEAKKFSAELTAKLAATPSVAWKMLMSARPEVVLWVAYSTKNAGLQAKFKNFYNEWPQARQKIPYVLMQEMRIVPGVDKYDELVDKLFFELMDGKLGTAEEMKAFLEPYSPPAPPPPVHLRRARATKKEAKVPKSRKKAEAEDGSAPGEGGLEEVASAAEGAAPATAAKAGSVKTKAAGSKQAEAKVAAPAKAVVPAKQTGKAAAPAKAVSAKAPAKKAVAAKAPAKKTAAKPVATKVAAKPIVKKAAPAKKIVAKKAPVKTVAKKAAPKKVAAKPAAKSGAKAKSSAKAPTKKKR